MSIPFYILLVAITIILIIVLGIPTIFGAPYLPTDKKAIKTMIKFSQATVGDRIADLGSGDGRIVIEFAKKGIEAHGYEINPLLVVLSKYKIKKAKLQNKAFIHWSNYWRVDFSKFNIVTIFGKTSQMKMLGNKLEKELKPDSRALSFAFRFPTWTSVRHKDGVSLYKTSD